MKWPADIAWNSPAGQLLSLLGEIVPANRRTSILLFGSAALQVTIAPSVLSEDADVAPDVVPYSPDSNKFKNALGRVELAKLIRDHKLGKGQRKLHLQVNAYEAFDPGSRWGRRVMTVERGNIQITIPHPIDILIAKLHRYEAKDLEAFKMVLARTGFPTAEELLAELRANHRLFKKQERSHANMPSQFPESKIAQAVPKLFTELYGKRINVRRDILLPAEQAVAESYNDHKKGHQSALEETANFSLKNLAAAQGSDRKPLSGRPEAPHVGKKISTESTTKQITKKPQGKK